MRLIDAAEEDRLPRVPAERAEGDSTTGSTKRCLPLESGRFLRSTIIRYVFRHWFGE
jgi:hypothetical protein